MCIVKINTATPLRVLEKTLPGKTRNQKASKSINILVQNELLTGPKKLYFQVVVKVPKSACLGDDEAETRAVHYLQNHLANELSTAKSWTFFRPTWENCAAQEPRIVFSRHPCLGISVKPSPYVANEITRTIEYLDIVRYVFEVSNERLATLAFHETATGFRRTLQEARPLFHALEDIAACSGDTQGYTAADIRAAARYYEELANRTVDNASSYKVALYQLRKIVWGIKFPSCWAARPCV